MTVYADTSFFVSLYLEDRHSKDAEELISSGEPVWCTPFHRAEYAHAVARQVFYKKLTASEADNAHADLEDDREAGLWIEIGMPENAFDLCIDLGRRHGPKLGVRTLDTLHVACALELKAERFWTFDESQAKLAKAEGLKTT